MKKRILNWAWYGFENFGDDLLLNTMIQELSCIPDTELCFAMNTVYDLTNDQVLQCQRSYKKLFFGIKDYDCLIFGPGGLFPFQNTAKCLIILLCTLWWRLRGKRVIFFGIGISSRMNKLNSFLWKITARISNAFLTRSKGLKECLRTNRITEMPDAAFASRIVEPRSTYNHGTVGIAVANLGESDTANYTESVGIWKELVQRLVKDGKSVDLIAFTKGTDDKLADDISRSLDGESIEKVHVYHYEQMDVVIPKWADYEQTICMRFHSLVLSLLAGVAPLPIAYGDKTVTLAQDCGLSDYIIYWNTAHSSYLGGIHSTTALDIYEHATKEQGRREAVLQTIEPYRKRTVQSSIDAFDFLKKHLQ